MSATPPEPNAGFSGCVWPIDEGCLGEEWDDYTDEVKDRATALATNTLRRLTGYRVGGCPILVRPCKQSCGSGARYGYTYGSYSWFQPYINGAGAWVNDCGCVRDCSCTTLCTVNLPGPVGEVYEVKVDGDVVDEDDYKLFGETLIWTGSGACPWPTCQNLALDDEEEDTFSVSYLNSYPVDGLGAYAAGVLAREYAISCEGGTCRLPASVTAITRQGLTYEITPGAFPDGFTGIREVDAYIALWNPKGLRQQMTVWTPQTPRVHH